jgi:hypothetical protein
MNYKCKTCNKLYKSYQSLWNHNHKFHNTIKNNSNQLVNNNDTKSKYACRICNKILSCKQSKWKHEQTCKNKETNENDKIKKEIELAKIQLLVKKEESQILQCELKLQNDRELELLKIKEKNKELEYKNKQNEEIINKLSLPMNNQLINIIEDKNKKIEELQLNNKVIINKDVTTTETLTLNNIVIVSRSEDNYINATQLCQAGGKQFKHWYSLESTKQLINEAACEAVIPTSQLVDIKKGNSSEFNQGSWIHPDLAIQLAQWISPKFALQISKWIRTLFTTGNVSVDVKLLEDKNNELKIKDTKIKLLEDMHLKKHKRVNYPERNVIYMLTTEDNKKKRNYVIGKAINLTTRLTSYNKSSEHEVVYFKECKSEEDMNAIEIMVLLKLRKYQEKANRDRFILPLEKDISFFTDIIDNCINFF